MQWFKSLPVQHPKTILSVGVLLLLASGVYGLGIFPKLAADTGAFNSEGSESSKVDELIAHDFGGSGGDALVLFTREHGNASVEDEVYQKEVDRLLTKLQPATKTTFYTTGSSQFVSNDKHDTYALVTMNGTTAEQTEKLISFMDKVDSSFLNVKVGGTMIGQHQAVEQTKHDLEKAELISLPIVALLLLFFFRSVVASAIPLVMAGLTICGALAVSHFIQRFTVIDTYTINVITILGLGLSVDYSLLAVNRFREELNRGLHRKEAASITARTAGRTIIFSALTVIICLLSLLVFPVGFMHSISIGGAAAVLVAMAVSSILIPALFSLLGHNIDRWRIPLPQSKQPGKLWRRLANLGVRWPWPTLIAGIALVGLFIIPISHVQSAPFDYRALPNNSSAFMVGKTLHEKFDSQSPSITLLTTYDTPPTITDMCLTAERISSMRYVSALTAPYMPSAQLSCAQMGRLAQFNMLPSALTSISDKSIKGNVTKIDITPKDDITDPSTVELIKDLRAMKQDGASFKVGGQAALDYDTLMSYATYTPFALAIIVAAMLIILTFSLGSITIPLQAVLINSLGLVIAVGSLVLLYQFGWLQPLFDQTVTGGLNPSMPILICVIAFGLSMDYAVFLYSRMHEIYNKTHDAKRAILEGVEKTGPIITAAALVFFAVVAAFAMSRISMMQQIGFGLAVAVIVDAFIIRILFVPAVMRLFGKSSWYAPRWIKRFVIKHD